MTTAAGCRTTRSRATRARWCSTSSTGCSRHRVATATGRGLRPLGTLDSRCVQAQEENGVGFCNTTKCCPEVCAEHIKITDNALIPLKERAADRKYDPVVWLGNQLFRRS